jgi:RNA polymerase-interacting CarD/CdnL/TRCF family regulator
MESQTGFTPGSQVIYGMHGKCSVLAVETREAGGKSFSFYKLEIQKSPLSRSTRHEPAIWVPVETAQERGLRQPSNKEQAEEIMKVLASREYFFSIYEPWNTVQAKLDTVIRNEGAIGLAKALSYLFVIKKKQIVPPSEAVKMYDAVNRLLFKELSEALGENARSIEERALKSMRPKLLLDQ